MNRDITENNIRLLPRVSGDFTWQDNQTLIFTPRRALPISKTLTVQISQDARSWLGRASDETVQSRFTTLAYPHVVAAAPALDAQFVYVPTHVALTFNRALNPESVRKNFSVTPPLANQTLRIDENQIVLGGFFQPRTRYHITLGANATDDAYAIPLERDIVWSFTIAEQYPNFSILNRGRVLEFPAQTEIKIPTQFTNVSRLDAALYPLTQNEFDANAAAPFETWYAFQPTRAPVLQKSFTTNAPLDEYMQQTLVLEPLARGAYFLKITTPEGPADAQLVRVR